MSLVATVDLVRHVQDTTWHIVGSDEETTRCMREIPADAVREPGMDAHVFAYRGKRVCAHCRKAAS